MRWTSPPLTHTHRIHKWHYMLCPDQTWKYISQNSLVSQVQKTDSSHLIKIYLRPHLINYITPSGEKMYWSLLIFTLGSTLWGLHLLFLQPQSAQTSIILDHSKISQRLLASSQETDSWSPQDDSKWCHSLSPWSIWPAQNPHEQKKKDLKCIRLIEYQRSTGMLFVMKGQVRDELRLCPCLD